MADSREINHQWYTLFEEDRMVLSFAVTDGDGWEVMHQVPARYEVCDTCSGKGTHVNPSIDSNGLTASDFAEDPDLAENYFSGLYDVPCVECGGRRVVPVVDEARCTPEQKRRAEEAQEEHYRDQVEQWHERRMGY